MMAKRIDPLERMQKSRESAEANRKQLLERMRAIQSLPKATKPMPEAKPADSPPSTPFESLDLEAALAAAARLRLMALEPDVGPPTQLNRPTLLLLQEFLITLARGESAAVLQWPFGQRDISLLHPLAMLALLCTPEKRTQNNYNWCEPAFCFRTLYFPWRGGATASSQGHILARRKEIIDWNRFHLTRRQVHATAESVLDKLHVTLGHLDRLKQRDTTKPHLAHPTLGEVYPVFVADSAEFTPRPFSKAAFELFERVRFGAAIDQLTDHRPALSVPAQAPYGFFGVSAGAQLKQAMAAPAFAKNSGLSPNICLLDLGPPSLSRLGPDWGNAVDRFLVDMAKLAPDVPILAITHDPFVHQKTAGLLRSHQKRAPRSKIVLRVSRDPISVDAAIDTVSPTTAKFTAVSGPVADAIAALSEAARGSSDPAFAGLLRREMGSLRKAASLPCGLEAAYNLLSAAQGQSVAEAFLERRSPASVIAPLRAALEGAVAGAERQRIASAHDAVQKAFNTLNEETPIGSVLAELVPDIVGKSSPSILVFASESERLLVETRFADASDTGRKLRRHLDRGFIVFASVEELDGKLRGIEASAGKNSWKRLILVAPSLDWLSTLVTRAWLPETVWVVCEWNLVSRIADTFHRLAGHPDISGSGQLGERLAAFADAARSERQARSVGSVELELEPHTSDSAPEMIIDLVDDDGDDDGEIILLSLATSRVIRARPRQTIVCYNAKAEVNPFERSTARDIKPGAAIVTPDNSFIEEAREVLPIRVLAQSWVEIYHTTVKALLPAVAGDSLNAKARTVLGAIQARGARTQSQAAVSGWLKVDEYMQIPADQRQPHAPQARREFSAFMEVLGVNDSLAEKMWLEGIQPLRIDRRRAGHQMAQAFVSVLVDPHGTTSGLGAAVRERIQLLRKKALDHLDQVVATRTIEAGAE